MHGWVRGVWRVCLCTIMQDGALEGASCVKSGRIIGRLGWVLSPYLHVWFCIFTSKICVPARSVIHVHV